jgi:hypothetical protein
MIQLRQKKLIIADHPAQAQQGVAQRRALPITMNFRVLREQLAQQCGTCPGQPRHTNEIRSHRNAVPCRMLAVLCADCIWLLVII